MLNPSDENLLQNISLFMSYEGKKNPSKCGDNLMSYLQFGGEEFLSRLFNIIYKSNLDRLDPRVKILKKYLSSAETNTLCAAKLRTTITTAMIFEYPDLSEILPLSLSPASASVVEDIIPTPVLTTPAIPAAAAAAAASPAATQHVYIAPMNPLLSETLDYLNALKRKSADMKPKSGDLIQEIIMGVGNWLLTPAATYQTGKQINGANAVIVTSLDRLINSFESIINNPSNQIDQLLQHYIELSQAILACLTKDNKRECVDQLDMLTNKYPEHRGEGYFFFYHTTRQIPACEIHQFIESINARMSLERSYN
jgi:hypothetical protein